MDLSLIRASSIFICQSTPRCVELISSYHAEVCSRSSYRSHDFFIDFDEFWNRIKATEDFICENAYRIHTHPQCFGEKWSEDFAESYAQISHALKKLRTPRFFPVPKDLKFCTCPISAETAHQALMFFLNPQEDVCGEADALNSREYKAIKRQAEEELGQLQELNDSRLQRLAKPKETPRGEKNSFEFERAVFYVLVMHHRENPEGPVNDPFKSQRDITDRLKKYQSEMNATNPRDKKVKLPTSQPTVSRAMTTLLGRVKDRCGDMETMMRYRKLCAAGQIVQTLDRIEKSLFNEKCCRERSNAHWGNVSVRGMGTEYSTESDC